MTGIEWRYLAGISLPKILSLVQGILRRASLVDVRIVRIRHDLKRRELE